jgi:hypothetical protein
MLKTDPKTRKQCLTRHLCPWFYSILLCVFVGTASMGFSYFRSLNRWDQTHMLWFKSKNDCRNYLFKEVSSEGSVSSYSIKRFGVGWLSIALLNFNSSGDQRLMLDTPPPQN